MANPLLFDNVDDDIESLIHCPTSTNFTALLGLSPNQALYLLHHPPNNISENFQYTPKPKSEPPDSCPIAGEKPQRTAKRKESENNGKVKAVAVKKRKSTEESTGGDEKLPYVHVRARRGEATDSHSLAERARREKINARMKLLQEIVPGCSKISGTALVLDQIINHVQCLQRQVEFLSMRLATVNPRVDFGCIDRFLSAEFGRVTTSTLPGWSPSGHPHHQVWHVDSVRQYEQSSAISSLSFIPTTASSSTPVPCSSPTASSLTAARL